MDENREEHYTPNWEIFSFEEELEARKSKSKTFNEELKKIVQVNIDRSESQTEDEICKIQHNQHNLKNLELLNEKLMTQEIHLKNSSVSLSKDIQNLKIQNASSEIKLNEVTKNVSSLKEKWKQYREAYDLALKTYLTNFDLDVKIEPISDETFYAYIKFISVTNMTPIKVTVNRIQKSIIDFNCELLESEENDGKEIMLRHNKAVLLAEIRNHLLNKYIEL